MTNVRDIMADVNGTSFIGIDTLTVPQVNKTIDRKEPNPHYGRVTKRMSGASVMVFQNKSGSAYGAMVERRLKKEGKDPASFELQPRKWGERLTGTPFVEHNDQLYLEVIFLKPGKVEYMIDGKVVPKDSIIGLRDRAMDPEQGGLEDKVVIRTFKVDSLERITINKTAYTEIEQ